MRRGIVLEREGRLTALSRAAAARFDMVAHVVGGIVIELGTAPDAAPEAVIVGAVVVAPSRTVSIDLAPGALPIPLHCMAFRDPADGEVEAAWRSAEEREAAIAGARAGPLV